MKEKKAALIVIDMEQGFIAEESPLRIQGALETVVPCGQVIVKGRQVEIPVFFVNRVYRKNGSDVEFTRYESWLAGGRYLAPHSTGSTSTEVPEEFVPQKGDYTLTKPRYSAFFQTELDLILRRLQVDTIILIGTTTPNCIRATCYDGISLDYNVVIIEDCCSSNTKEIQRANMEDMERVGATILSAETFLKEGISSVQNLVLEVQDKVIEDETDPE